MDWGGGTIMSVVEETDKFEFPVEIQIKGKLFLTFLFMAL
jgi:hypothetical protein